MRNVSNRGSSAIRVKNDGGHSEIVRLALSIVGALLLSLATFSSVLLAADAPASSGPLAETKALVDRGITILRDSELSLTEKRRELRDLAEQHFDFADMAHSALGYHWRTLSQEQRTEFVPVFSAFIEDAYLNKIQQYSGQAIEVINQLSDGPNYATVNTRIIGQALLETLMWWRIFTANVLASLAMFAVLSWWHPALTACLRQMLRAYGSAAGQKSNDTVLAGRRQVPDHGGHAVVKSLSTGRHG